MIVICMDVLCFDFVFYALFFMLLDSNDLQSLIFFFLLCLCSVFSESHWQQLNSNTIRYINGVYTKYTLSIF